ncbi:RloB family protein [Flavivirga amylovorans]|uniref:RloB family protein n=1 Tax=Flavivirga amylovorans TaxID=870486 RepID=A0ABT8X5U4_9FLAO|nr:RloB family protein [Flavivirga amylovorans]MDO5989366.1 RloB family protein [Flavivirga amylovorans]
MARSRRKSKGKKINPTLFVFCEGDTEETYINMLKSLFRLSSIQIHPKIGGNNITEKYIQNYKKDKPTHDKDIDYLMYDLDVPEIVDRLNKIANCTLLLSNPCIELWFLLHYKNHKANNDGAYFCKELKNRNKTYKKGVIDKKLKEKLTTKIDDAIKRAKSLDESKNPSSTIYKLLEKLDELKK